MIKKLPLILILLILLNVFPTVTAVTSPLRTHINDTEVIERTFIRGFILFPRETNNGATRTFFAIRLHYTTFTIDGAAIGNIRLRTVSIPNLLTGYSNRIYIIGTFHGSIDI
jgi:hypothetical protein